MNFFNERNLIYKLALAAIFVLVVNAVALKEYDDELEEADYETAWELDTVAPIGRVSNGQNASEDSKYFMVSCVFHKPHNTTHNKTVFGSGFAISQKWVLTSRHGVLDAFRVVLTFGSLRRNDPLGTKRTVLPTEIYMFNVGLIMPYYIDIALLELDTAVEFIVPLALPCNFYAGTGDCGTFYGWGRTSETDPLANHVQEADMCIGEPWICPFNTWDKFCVPTVNGISLCGGDSGGPLVMQYQNCSLAVGLGVTSTGCGTPNSRSQMVIINYTIIWIQSITSIPCPTCTEVV